MNSGNVGCNGPVSFTCKPGTGATAPAEETPISAPAPFSPALSVENGAAPGAAEPAPTPTQTQAPAAAPVSATTGTVAPQGTSSAGAGSFSPALSVETAVGPCAAANDCAAAKGLYDDAIQNAIVAGNDLIQATNTLNQATDTLSQAKSDQQTGPAQANYNNAFANYKSKQTAYTNAADTAIANFYAWQEIAEKLEAKPVQLAPTDIGANVIPEANAPASQNKVATPAPGSTEARPAPGATAGANAASEQQTEEPMPALTPEEQAQAQLAEEEIAREQAAAKEEEEKQRQQALEEEKEKEQQKALEQSQENPSMEANPGGEGAAPEANAPGASENTVPAPTPSDEGANPRASEQNGTGSQSSGTVSTGEGATGAGAASSATKDIIVSLDEPAAQADLITGDNGTHATLTKGALTDGGKTARFALPQSIGTGPTVNVNGENTVLLTVPKRMATAGSSTAPGNNQSAASAGQTASRDPGINGYILLADTSKGSQSNADLEKDSWTWGSSQFPTFLLLGPMPECKSATSAAAPSNSNASPCFLNFKFKQVDVTSVRPSSSNETALPSGGIILALPTATPATGPLSTTPGVGTSASASNFYIEAYRDAGGDVVTVMHPTFTATASGIIVNGGATTNAASAKQQAALPYQTYLGGSGYTDSSSGGATVPASGAGSSIAATSSSQQPALPYQTYLGGSGNTNSVSTGTQAISSAPIKFSVTFPVAIPVTEAEAIFWGKTTSPVIIPLIPTPLVQLGTTPPSANSLLTFTATASGPHAIVGQPETTSVSPNTPSAAAGSSTSATQPATPTGTQGTSTGASVTTNAGGTKLKYILPIAGGGAVAAFLLSKKPGNASPAAAPNPLNMIILTVPQVPATTGSPTTNSKIPASAFSGPYVFTAGPLLSSLGAGPAATAPEIQLQAIPVPACQPATSSAAPPNTNGMWSLYVQTSENTSAIAGGWCLDFSAPSVHFTSLGGWTLNFLANPPSTSASDTATGGNATTSASSTGTGSVAVTVPGSLAATTPEVCSATTGVCTTGGTTTFVPSTGATGAIASNSAGGSSSASNSVAAAATATVPASPSSSGSPTVTSLSVCPSLAWQDAASKLPLAKVISDGTSPGFGVDIKTPPGLNTTIFTTPRSDRIEVYLPSVLLPGQTFSASMKVVPKDPADQKELNSYSFRIGGQPTGLSTGIFSAAVPAATAGSSTDLVLVDKKGKEQAGVSLPLSSTPPSPPLETDLPASATYGDVIVIHAPMQGAFAPTDYVKIGGVNVQLLAKSANELVALDTSDVPGPTEIESNVNGTVTKGPFRNFTLKLWADQYHLLKGQGTTVHILVSGLEKLQTAAPMTIDTSGTVTMAGGNSQALSITPSDVQPHGTYSTDRALSSYEAGDFRVVVTVRVNPICGSADQP